MNHSLILSGSVFHYYKVNFPTSVLKYFVFVSSGTQCLHSTSYNVFMQPMLLLSVVTVIVLQWRSASFDGYVRHCYVFVTFRWSGTFLLGRSRNW